MGYTTNFTGEFRLNKPLQPEHQAYLEKFATTRRMRRNAELTQTRDDPLRLAAKLPVGIEGGYFVGAEGSFGQEGFSASDVTDNNHPPKEQPGLWCQWTPSPDGQSVVWDEGEKFYNYVEWLEYLITHFLQPWDYVLNGEVQWSGEEPGDLGKIIVKNNKVVAKTAKISFD